MKNNNRSYLFVPATDKLLSKIPLCKADAVIIDLEDSIPESDKMESLKRVVEFLKDNNNQNIYIRINSDNYKEEISQLDGFEIKGYMIPKTETVSDVDKISAVTSKEIIALVESINGVINIDSIAKCDRVSAIAFGAEDFTSQAGIFNDDFYLSYTKNRIVLHTKACNKNVIDTISLNIKDEEKYRAVALNSKKFGFDGKLAIHPMQVDIINDIFNDDIKLYVDIVSKYDSSDLAVLEIDGKIYEKPHIDAMKRKIKEYYND